MIVALFSIHFSAPTLRASAPGNSAVSRARNPVICGESDLRQFCWPSSNDVLRPICVLRSPNDIRQDSVSSHLPILFGPSNVLSCVLRLVEFGPCGHYARFGQTRAGTAVH